MSAAIRDVQLASAWLALPGDDAEAVDDGDADVDGRLWDSVDEVREE
jgi:hypothetical protein